MEELPEKAATYYFYPAKNVTLTENASIMILIRTAGSSPAGLNEYRIYRKLEGNFVKSAVIKYSMNLMGPGKFNTPITIY